MNLLSDMAERVRSIIFRSRDERELAEELALHAEMEAEHLERQGVNAVEPRRRSALALSGVERVKDDVRDARGTRLLHDSGRDFGFALRTLARNPGFASVAILTLAVGIGGTTAVFSAVDAVLLQPLPYQQPGQLVRLYYTDARRKVERSYVTAVHFLDYRQEMSSFGSIAALFTYDETGADIGTGDDVRRVRALRVSADYFDVIRVPPVLGRPFQRDEENAAYVYHAHRQYAGDRNWALTQAVRTTGSLDQLQAEVRRTISTLDRQLVMYKPLALSDAIGQGEAQRVFTLRLLTTFAGVALALAALGLFGVLSYGVRLRSREFGIRMALGANRGSIRRMVLREGMVVTGIGTVIGLLGAVAVSRVMASMVFGIGTLDPRVMAAAAAFMAVVAAIATYLPAYRATAVEPSAVLQ